MSFYRVTYYISGIIITVPGFTNIDPFKELFAAATTYHNDGFPKYFDAILSHRSPIRDVYSNGNSSCNGSAGIAEE